MTKPRIAVIGSGISGLSAAWLLRNSADITLYEANKRFGGHTHTYSVQEMSNTVPIDTGFMVFNHRNYPNLVKLFQHLGIDQDREYDDQFLKMRQVLSSGRPVYLG